MATSRKDSKGRVLRKGETYRKTDGRYQYAYTDIYGQRRFLYAKDLADLREREADISRDLIDSIDSTRAQRITLNEMFYTYMKTREDLAPHTSASYIYQYEAYVKNKLGKRHLKDLKYSDFLTFYLDLMNKQGMSIGSVEHLNRVVHPVLDMAVRDCIIRSNPTDKIVAVLKKRSGASKGVKNALTPQQQRDFLTFLDGHPVYDHFKPMFTFLLGTGLRVGELGALTWDKIDFENNEITIDCALTYFAGKFNTGTQRLFITTPKTEAGIRKVPLVSEVKKALEEEKRNQEEQGLFCNVVIDGKTDFVFLNRFGGVCIQSSMDRNLARIINAFNEEEIHQAKLKGRQPNLLPHFTCHSLRHTFCARLCENETNLKVIQSIMGHTDIKTTMNVYAEVSEEKKKESLNAISMKLNLF